MRPCGRLSAIRSVEETVGTEVEGEGRRGFGFMEKVEETLPAWPPKQLCSRSGRQNTPFCKQLTTLAMFQRWKDTNN